MLEDPSAYLISSNGWEEISSAVAAERCSQSLAVFLPSSMQELFVSRFAELTLGSDTGWKDGTHPDLINAGKYLIPPTIDECRMIRSELALHPLAAHVRLAVVWEADKLSLEAANSLLKLTEEPPLSAQILFVSEEDKLIPTIKSRVWSVHIDLPAELASPHKPPATTAEWADFLDGKKKITTEAMYMEIECWVKYMTEKEDYLTASKLESMSRIMEQRRLSVSMIQDALYAILKEGIPCEQVFGSIW